MTRKTTGTRKSANLKDLKKSIKEKAKTTRKSTQKGVRTRVRNATKPVHLFPPLIDPWVDTFTVAVMTGAKPPPTRKSKVVTKVSPPLGFIDNLYDIPTFSDGNGELYGIDTVETDRRLKQMNRHGVYMKWGLPTMYSTTVSCGARQFAGIHGMPALYIIAHQLLLLERDKRWSTLIFSDWSDNVAKGGDWAAKLTKEIEAKRLVCKFEIDDARNRHPGENIAKYITEADGVLGSVVQTEWTRNRNSGNEIKTYLWTIPFSKDGRASYSGARDDKFDYRGALAYINGLRKELWSLNEGTTVEELIKPYTNTVPAAAEEAVDAAFAA